MNDYFKQQTEQFMNAAKGAKIPESVQAFAEESVAKSREAFGRMQSVAQDQVKTTEEVLLATQAGARVLGAKLIDNTTSNAYALFDAAAAIAQAKSPMEAARLQAEFMQKQFAAATAQAKELFDLSTRVTHETLETVNSATTKSFEQARKSV